MMVVAAAVVVVVVVVVAAVVTKSSARNLVPGHVVELLNQKIVSKEAEGYNIEGIQTSADVHDAQMLH